MSTFTSPPFPDLHSPAITSPQVLTRTTLLAPPPISTTFPSFPLTFLSIIFPTSPPHPSLLSQPVFPLTSLTPFTPLPQFSFQKFPHPFRNTSPPLVSPTSSLIMFPLLPLPSFSYTSHSHFLTMPFP